MITRPAGFRVLGEPAPKGSLMGSCLTHPKIGQVCARGPRVELREAVNRGRPWRRAIEKAAALHIEERADQYQPIAVALGFAVTRLASQKGMPYPTKQSAKGVGGDLDKMVRLVLDALQSSGVLHNDAQVTNLSVRKAFADDPVWWEDADHWRGKPGLHCRVEPAVYMPPELPYETRLDEQDMT